MEKSVLVSGRRVIVGFENAKVPRMLGNRVRRLIIIKDFERRLITRDGKGGYPDGGTTTSTRMRSQVVEFIIRHVGDNKQPLLFVCSHHANLTLYLVSILG